MAGDFVLLTLGEHPFRTLLTFFLIESVVDELDCVILGSEEVIFSDILDESLFLEFIHHFGFHLEEVETTSPFLEYSGDLFEHLHTGHIDEVDTAREYEDTVYSLFTNYGI